MADDLIKEAREKFQAGLNADQENRDEAVRDLKFLAGEQWEQADIDARTKDGRPYLTFNRLPQYERQVTGDMRLNPPGVKVRPVDGGSDPKTAETLTGLIRNIEAQSDGVGAYITAATNAVRCGEGWFGIGYDYADPNSFHMELSFRRIPNPLAVVCDPGATDPTRNDMHWAFNCDLIPEAQFKAEYPKASLTGFDDPTYATWRNGDFIRVAEYWYRKAVTRKLALLGSGATLDLTEMGDAEIRDIAAQAGGIVRERDAASWKVCMQLMSGAEPLDDLYEWPGTYIPLIRVGGDEINIGDRVVRYGMVRFARDPQKLYNLQRTSLAEAASMAPKAKWVGTVKQFAGHLVSWANANRSTKAVLQYTADPAAPGPPQRIAPDVPAQSVLTDVQLSAQDIEATIGVYRDNLGRESNAESGRAILSRQREGDVGTYIYPDNLARAVAQGGRVLIDVIPKVMDTPRMVRILGEDGGEDFVPLNALDPYTGRMVNDLSVGRYDVVSSVGPSFSTRREEARESMMAFFSASPQAAQLSGDLFAKNMDWPGAEEIAKRLRRTLPPGLADPEPDDPPPQPPQPDPNMLAAQAQMVLAQAEQMKQQTAQQELQLKAFEAEQNAAIERAKLALEAEKLKINVGHLQLDAISTQAKIRNDDTMTRVNAAGKATDTMQKLFAPRQQPGAPQTQQGPAPR